MPIRHFEYELESSLACAAEHAERIERIADDSGDSQLAAKYCDIAGEVRRLITLATEVRHAADDAADAKRDGLRAALDAAHAQAVAS